MPEDGSLAGQLVQFLRELGGSATDAALRQRFPDEEQLAAKRAEIERELKSFADTIWVPQEKAEEMLPAKKKEASDTVRVSKAGTQLIDSGNKRSVRRNRRTKEVLQ